jgi:glycosyltransferase involved in cell wall biosynthesis
MAGEAPRISVIVPCYRDPELLDDLLRSLESESASSEGTSFEVIVVDSGLDDRVAATAERFGARGLRGTEKLLSGHARNFGARYAAGSVLAFIDTDCVPEPGWIEAIARAMRTEARLIGGPVLNRLPWYTIASVDNLLQFADYGPGRPAGPIRHVPSCNMAVRRDDFFSLGGFASGPSGEDVLLTEAVNEAWPGGLIYVPEMRVVHMGRRELGEMMGHHHGFGYARGALDLHLSEWHRRWGRWALVIPAVMLKRLAYICEHGVGSGRTSLAHFVVTLPLIMAGLLAWAIGFRSGLRAGRE